MVEGFRVLVFMLLGIIGYCRSFVTWGCWASAGLFGRPGIKIQGFVVDSGLGVHRLSPLRA